MPLASLRFSLILPCLSSPEVLRRTLAGISDQSFEPTGFEVIVVDDYSEPPLKPTACEFAGDLVYIRNPQNLGRAASRNRGIAASRGEILVFMDVDQLLEPGFLAALDRSFGENLRQSVRANTSVWPPLLAGSAFLRYYNSRFIGNRSPSEIDRIGLTNLRPKYYATTCIATGRAIVLEVGGFDESFRVYGCEDEELGARLAKAGAPLKIDLEAKSYSFDEDLTVSRACRRLIDYAGKSVPLILSKHPDYTKHLKMSFLEAPNSFSQKILERSLKWFYRPWIAKLLLRYLESNDRRASFRPPATLYSLAFVGYYLIGLRNRGRIEA